MNICKSSEDYLEMILMLSEEKGDVRSVDIAVRLQVSKPSVSYAMKQLRENGYILMDRDNYISLTEKGMDIADCMYKRHKGLIRFLTGIGVNEETAKKDACRIEHDISNETFEAISRCAGE